MPMYSDYLKILQKNVVSSTGLKSIILIPFLVVNSLWYLIFIYFQKLTTAISNKRIFNKFTLSFYIHTLIMQRIATLTYFFSLVCL